MLTKTLKPKTLDLIDKYLYLDLPLKIACPYFNNKKLTKMAGLRVQIGKGKPEEIIEEIKVSALTKGIDLKNLNQEQLIAFLTEQNIGIDCSGLVYHILNKENKNRGLGSLSDKLRFTGSFIRKIISKFRSAQNSDVRIFDKNSRTINLKEVEPGDFIIALNQKGLERNHIILITETKKEADVLREITYLHSIAWSKDGMNDRGVRTGTIEIINPDLGILNQTWVEKEKIGEANETFKGLNSAEDVKIKRLNWF